MRWYQSCKDMPPEYPLPEAEIIFCFLTFFGSLILAGGCSQHEKASCMAITLDTGRSLDIDTWQITELSKNLLGWTLTSFSGWHFCIKENWPLRCGELGALHSFFGASSTPVTCEGWERSSTGIVLFCVTSPFAIPPKKGMNIWKMIFGTGGVEICSPNFMAILDVVLKRLAKQLEVWVLTWTPKVQGCPETLNGSDGRQLIACAWVIKHGQWKIIWQWIFFKGNADAWKLSTWSTF